MHRVTFRMLVRCPLQAFRCKKVERAVTGLQLALLENNTLVALVLFTDRSVADVSSPLKQ
jgi:hypothetical protein